MGGREGLGLVEYKVAWARRMMGNEIQFLSAEGEERGFWYVDMSMINFLCELWSAFGETGGLFELGVIIIVAARVLRCMNSQVHQGYSGVC